MHLKFLQVLRYKHCSRLLDNCRANIKYSLPFDKPYGPMSVGRFMISEIKHSTNLAENVC